MANAVAKNKSLTQSNVENVISIYIEEHDNYKHLYHDHRIRRVLIALRMAISKLEDQLRKS